MENITELADIFKALSDPTRLKIVKQLSDNEKMLCVCYLTQNLKVTQSAVSQHLRVLKQAGIVISERRGYFIHYGINKDVIGKINSLLKETLGEK